MARLTFQIQVRQLRLCDLAWYSYWMLPLRILQVVPNAECTTIESHFIICSCISLSCVKYASVVKWWRHSQFMYDWISVISCERGSIEKMWTSNIHVRTTSTYVLYSKRGKHGSAKGDRCSLPLVSRFTYEKCNLQKQTPPCFSAHSIGSSHQYRSTWVGMNGRQS